MVMVLGPADPTAKELPDKVLISTVVMHEKLDANFLRAMEHFHLCGFFFRPAFRSVFVSRANKCAEQRMRLERLRLELRMELTSDEVRMIRQFDHFHVRSIGRRTGNLQACGRHWLFILAVELVAMPVALADFALAINAVRESLWLDLAGPRAQPHGASELFHTAQFPQLINHTMRRCRIE